jgi:hypothetical protein|tara:strand:- start:210 stop:437 length:228 start_codon:yes stop_codon:yes gene_type:complete
MPVMPTTYEIAIQPSAVFPSASQLTPAKAIIAIVGYAKDNKQQLGPSGASLALFEFIVPPLFHKHVMHVDNDVLS